MTDAAPDPASERPHDPVRRALMGCAVYFCVLGLALLVADLVSWAALGYYESPSALGLHAMRWLALPGIALSGGAAMVAASVRPARPWAFLIAMVLLLIYIWCWDMSQFIAEGPVEWGE